MTGDKLNELLRGVSHVTFKLEGVGEETHGSRVVHEAVQDLVDNALKEANERIEGLVALLDGYDNDWICEALQKDGYDCEKACGEKGDTMKPCYFEHIRRFGG